ncbi:MAG: peptidase M24 [Rhodospirillaceae bacterium]|nr:MAG: peptidase M24 [Rhodospirillaceae bacterium]
MTKTFARVLLVLGCFGLSAPVMAEGGSFIFPVDCEYGKTCWIPNYVDLKPGPGVLDYTCRDASYDAPPGDQHKGTDIAIQDIRALRDGVAVVAAASGVVIGQRDGLQDINYKERTNPLADTQFCGNGLTIQHGDGLITQYCHMKKGSVFFFKDDRVKQGDFLGYVGLSGYTDFPHLHFQITKDKQVIDPFAGFDRQKKCGLGKQPLWNTKTLEKTPYEPSVIFNAGFSFQKPDYKAIRTGLYKSKTVSTTVPALVAWAEMFRVKTGNTIDFVLYGPGGQKIHQKTVNIKADKVRYTAFSGLRRKGKQWPTGTYRATITLKHIRGESAVTRKIHMK